MEPPLVSPSEPAPGSFAAFVRRHASPNPATATWLCPTCGTIRPQQIKPGLYLRRTCACQRRRREEQEREALRRQRQADQRAQTFGWLGQTWAEPCLLQLTFARFERAQQMQAFEQAQTFAQAPNGTLALTGGYGSGKTHLLVAIANARRQANQPCLYVSAIALFAAIGQRIQQEQDVQPLLQRAARTPVLLIDDLDKPKPSPFRESVYYEIFDARCLAGLPQAITCNCPLWELERWIGGAALSRLMPGLIPLQMQGPDVRLSLRPRPP